MHDGRVTVDDLMENADPVELLVLSGCVTGVASRRPGDELAGLGRAGHRGYSECPLHAVEH